MGLKVPTCKEEIGGPPDKYSINHDISPNQSLFSQGGKKIRLLLGAGKDCELALESSELVGDQIMR